MIKKVMEKVLIVGSGLTGAFTANLLRERCPGLSVVIWDKARGIGGRMSTSRSPNNNECTVDLGLQYITVTPEYKNKYSRIYEELFSVGLLSPLTTLIDGDRTSPQKNQTDGDHKSNTTHYVAQKGCSSLVKHFLQKSGAEMKREHHVDKIDLTKGDKPYVTVSTQAGVTAHFDAVLLTMPVPQILQLQGSIQNALVSNHLEKERLEAVKYSSRFCLGLFYKEGVKFDVPWSAKYIPDHQCIRFVSLDTKKRGLGSEAAPSVLVHTSVPYGVSNVERDKEDVKQEIYQHFKTMFPDFPDPDYIKGHKWRYSQREEAVRAFISGREKHVKHIIQILEALTVSRCYEGSPGYLVLQENPLVICGGDGFTFSKFDGCIDSAEAVVNVFLQHLKTK